MLELEEFKSAFGGNTIPDESWKVLIAEVDSNNDGVISL